MSSRRIPSNRSLLALALALTCLPALSLAADPKQSLPPPANPPPTATPPEATLLPVGTPAPDFTATAHNGEKVTLSKLKGKNVVLYWYPKDDTAGCTKQACDIRDNWDRLKKAGVVVYGISTQDNTSHKAFADKYQLPFALLPDESGEIARKFGVPVVNGKARRMSVLIGKDGKIKQVWPKAATTGHAAEILAALDGK